MKPFLVAAALAVSGMVLPAPFLAGPSITQAATVRYDVPSETATFPPGPNRDVVQANCAGCHSADYQSTQPRGLANPTAFWSNEVAKMRKAYGAPIDDEDAAKIIAYLVETYR